MPTLYMMIGVPGSGKSTWIKNQNWTDNCVVVSTDYYVEKFARRLKTTYSECFDLVMNRALRLMIKKVAKARALNLDIVWDQTSTTIASRKRKFNMLPKYKVIGVVMKQISREDLNNRLNARPEKNIPSYVVDDMIACYEEPNSAEGFSELWAAD